MIHTNIDDLKTILSCGNKYHTSYGLGIGVDRARNSVLMAMNNLTDNINILEVKMVLFLFNLSTNVALFEVEDSIDMFKEKYNYVNDITFMCVNDEQMSKDESEVIIITSD